MRCLYCIELVPICLVHSNSNLFLGHCTPQAGVIGRLGDLGAIDEEYDVAISTACGHLDFIVVENQAGGKACIEYLKKHNLGRTSFIMLDKVRGNGG